MSLRDRARSIVPASRDRRSRPSRRGNRDARSARPFPGKQSWKRSPADRKDWKVAPYYDASRAAHGQGPWSDLIWPMIPGLRSVGGGRSRGRPWAQYEKLRQHAGRVTCGHQPVDHRLLPPAASPAIPAVDYHVCDGASLATISDGKRLPCLYTFDAMVHFDSDTVRAYLQDFLSGS